MSYSDEVLSIVNSLPDNAVLVTRGFHKVDTLVKYDNVISLGDITEGYISVIQGIAEGYTNNHFVIIYDDDLKYDLNSILCSKILNRVHLTFLWLTSEHSIFNKLPNLSSIMYGSGILYQDYSFNTLKQSLPSSLPSLIRGSTFIKIKITSKCTKEDVIFLKRS